MDRHRTAKLSEAKKLRHMWLAYTAATQNGVVPVIIFIRGLMYSTTISEEGERKPDPKGWHVTFSFKTQEQLDSGKHVSCQAYVDLRGNFAEVTYSPEKADSFKLNNGKEV
ncbi:hypothetical protein E4U30_006005 [Claviceps sp. LM220 group G6]|nr:hypothetical protein E4U30_006005 [Claviceps sp. LM220 group G6]